MACKRCVWSPKPLERAWWTVEVNWWRKAWWKASSAARRARALMCAFSAFPGLLKVRSSDRIRGTFDFSCFVDSFARLEAELPMRRGGMNFSRPGMLLCARRNHPL